MCHRVTREGRRVIYFMRKEGDGIGEIARRLGRSVRSSSSGLLAARGFPATMGV